MLGVLIDVLLECRSCLQGLINHMVQSLVLGWNRKALYLAIKWIPFFYWLMLFFTHTGCTFWCSFTMSFLLARFDNLYGHSLVSYRGCVNYAFLQVKKTLATTWKQKQKEMPLAWLFFFSLVFSLMQKCWRSLYKV